MDGNKRKLIVLTAQAWFEAAQDPQYSMEERLCSMENALNHTENALAAAKAELDDRLCLVCGVKVSNPAIYCEECLIKESGVEVEIRKLTEAKEKAEAQCATIRFHFAKYVRKNCKHIRHAVVDGLGYPDDVDGKCGGYCQNFDEPHESCQTCVAYAYPDEDGEPDAGAAILDQNKRMREFIQRVVGYDGIVNKDLLTTDMDKYLWFQGMFYDAKKALEA